MKLKQEMTKERALDKQIANKIFGAIVIVKGKRMSIGEPEYYDDAGLLYLSNPVDLYSINMDNAFSVVEELVGRKLGFSIVTVMDNGTIKWLAKFEQYGIDKYVIALDEIAPTAICLAALKAVEELL